MNINKNAKLLRKIKETAITKSITPINNQNSKAITDNGGYTKGFSGEALYKDKFKESKGGNALFEDDLLGKPRNLRKFGRRTGSSVSHNHNQRTREDERRLSQEFLSKENSRNYLASANSGVKSEDEYSMDAANHKQRVFQGEKNQRINNEKGSQRFQVDNTEHSRNNHNRAKESKNKQYYYNSNNKDNNNNYNNNNNNYNKNNNNNYYYYYYNQSENRKQEYYYLNQENHKDFKGTNSYLPQSYCNSIKKRIDYNNNNYYGYPSATNFNYTEKPYFNNYKGFHKNNECFTYGKHFGKINQNCSAWNQRLKSNDYYFNNQRNASNNEFYNNNYNYHNNQSKYSHYGYENANGPQKSRLERVIENLRYDINNYDALSSKSVISIINILFKENFNRLQVKKAENPNIKEDLQKHFPKLKLHLNTEEESSHLRSKENDTNNEPIIPGIEVSNVNDQQHLSEGMKKLQSFPGRRISLYCKLLEGYCIDNDSSGNKKRSLSVRYPQVAIRDELLKEEKQFGKCLVGGIQGFLTKKKTSKSFVFSLDSQKSSKISTIISSSKGNRELSIQHQSLKTVNLNSLVEQKTFKTHDSEATIGREKANQKKEKDLDLDNPVITKENYFEYYFYSNFTENILWGFLNQGRNLYYLLSEGLFLSLLKPYIDYIVRNEFMRVLFLQMALKNNQICYLKGVKFIEKILVKSPCIPKFMQDFIIENFNSLSKSQFSSHLLKVFLGKIEKLDEEQSKLIAENIKKEFDDYTKNAFACGVLISVLYAIQKPFKSIIVDCCKGKILPLAQSKIASFFLEKSIEQGGVNMSMIFYNEIIMEFSAFKDLLNSEETRGLFIMKRALIKACNEYKLKFFDRIENVYLPSPFMEEVEHKDEFIGMFKEIKQNYILKQEALNKVKAEEESMESSSKHFDNNNNNNKKNNNSSGENHCISFFYQNENSFSYSNRSIIKPDNKCGLEEDSFSEFALAFNEEQKEQKEEEEDSENDSSKTIKTIENSSRDGKGNLKVTSSSKGDETFKSLDCKQIANDPKPVEKVSKNKLRNDEKEKALIVSNNIEEEKHITADKIDYLGKVRNQLGSLLYSHPNEIISKALSNNTYNLSSSAQNNISNQTSKQSVPYQLLEPNLLLTTNNVNNINNNNNNINIYINNYNNFNVASNNKHSGSSSCNPGFQGSLLGGNSKSNENDYYYLQNKNNTFKKNLPRSLLQNQVFIDSNNITDNTFKISNAQNTFYNNADTNTNNNTDLLSSINNNNYNNSNNNNIYNANNCYGNNLNYYSTSFNYPFQVNNYSNNHNLSSTHSNNINYFNQNLCLQNKIKIASTCKVFPKPSNSSCTGFYPVTNNNILAHSTQQFVNDKMSLFGNNNNLNNTTNMKYYEQNPNDLGGQTTTDSFMNINNQIIKNRKVLCKTNYKNDINNNSLVNNQHFIQQQLGSKFNLISNNNQLKKEGNNDGFTSMKMVQNNGNYGNHQCFGDSLVNYSNHHQNQNSNLIRNQLFSGNPIYNITQPSFYGGSSGSLQPRENYQESFLLGNQVQYSSYLPQTTLKEDPYSLNNNNNNKFTKNSNPSVDKNEQSNNIYESQLFKSQFYL